MDSATRRLIESLHQAPYRCVLAMSGGGSGAAAQLLSVPGGSRTILEIIVPYSEPALAEFLGLRPEHFCSSQTSRAMARRAWDRARWLGPGETVVGLGCTASLASDRPKKGEHRFHVSCCRAGKTNTFSLTLRKGARDREGEENLLDRVILIALALAFRAEQTLDLALLPGENLHQEERLEPGLGEFFAGRREFLWLAPDGQGGVDRKAEALLPGSFNPVHEGHWKLAAAAQRILGKRVAFELSVDNPDKPSLEEEEVRLRLANLTWQGEVVLTRAPLFVQKSRLFPETVFVIGADTAERIVQPHYYQDESDLNQALAFLCGQGCRFLVAGRQGPAGKFIALEDLHLPARFRDLFSGIPSSDFRLDLSSTELREKHAAEKKALPAGG